jgi:hypothetical protein
MECVQIVGDLEAASLSRQTWLLLRQASLYHACSVMKEPVPFFLLSLADLNVSVLQDPCQFLLL